MIDAVFSNPIIAFVILVGVVVFVHELGHFLVGRWMGIDVEEFSLGFGPKAFGFKKGNTEYRVGWLPLGGYVRFYGSELGQSIPLEKRERSITTARLYKRAFVSIAGPGANFVLSLIIMIILSGVGLPQPAPVVSVIPDSVAEKAGFRSGDKIVSIDGSEIKSWLDFNKIVVASPGKELNAIVERNGETLSIKVTPMVSETEDPYGETIKVGRIGVTQFMLSPRIVVKEGGYFSQLGFKSGDLVTAVDNKPVRYFHEILESLEARKNSPGASFEVKIKRPDSIGDLAEFQAQLKKPENLGRENVLNISFPPGMEVGPFEDGVATTDLTLGAFEALKRGDKRTTALDAWKACGLQPGDTIHAIDGYGVMKNPVQLGMTLEKIQKTSKGAAALGITVWNFAGQERALRCEVPLREGRDALNREQSYLDFPFTFLTHGTGVPPVIIKSDSVLDAVRDGFKAAGEQASTIFAGIKKLVSGDVPLANLGGPIAIARVAGDAAQGGLLLFVLTISWMSINIGMFNLLPLPALDGGTLLLQSVEAAYGKPLPLKVQENVQKAGILIILGLIILVFYNDILRLFHS